MEPVEASVFDTSPKSAFAALLTWHFLESGAHPGKTHKGFRIELAAAMPSKTDEKTVGYWLSGEHLPRGEQEVQAIEDFCSDAFPGRSDTGEFLRLWKEHEAEKAAQRRLRKRVSAPAPSEAAQSPPSMDGEMSPPRIDHSLCETNLGVDLPWHFGGRDGDLGELDQLLNRQDGRLRRVAIHGLRGVGKSTLALAYARRHCGGHRAIWWINAEQEVRIGEGLIALGLRLGWFTETDDHALGHVLSRLEQEVGKILLVFDNAPDEKLIGPYLPRRGSCQVLITSNHYVWGSTAGAFNLGALTPEAGASFLIGRGRLNPARLDEATALSAALGHLPLALEQAAAWCEHTEKSAATYLQLFQTEPVTLLSDERFGPEDYHHRTVARTFAIAFERVASESPAAEMLLLYLAVLPPVSIPEFLFLENTAIFGSRTLTPNAFTAALQVLRRFALIDRDRIVDSRHADIGFDGFSMHRLVRLISQANCSADGMDIAFRDLIEASVRAYPDEEAVFDQHISWPRARALEPVIAALLDHATLRPSGMEEAIGSLLSRRASYYHRVGTDPNIALDLWRNALDFAEQHLGDSHVLTATIHNNIGAYLITADAGMPAALYHHERAFQLRVTLLGPGLPVARSAANLGDVLRDMGKGRQALPFFEIALSLGEQEAPDTLLLVHIRRAAGRLYHSLGDQINSLSLIKAAIDLCRKLAPDSMEMAQVLQTAAIVFFGANKGVAAKSALSNAAAIQSTIFGPDDINTLGVQLDLVDLLIRLGKEREATQLCREAYRKAHRIKHTKRHLATTYNTIAHLCVAKRKPKAAEAFYLRALLIFQTLGIYNDGEQANIAANMADLALQEREPREAARIYRQVLRARRVCYTVPSHGVALTLERLARVYEHLKRPSIVARLDRLAAAMYAEIFGEPANLYSPALRDSLEALVAVMPGVVSLSAAPCSPAPRSSEAAPSAERKGRRRAGTPASDSSPPDNKSSGGSRARRK